MSGMAEVLAAHAFNMISPVDIDDLNGAWQVECNCDSAPIQGPSFLAAEQAFAAHQAAMLTAAGFGPVKEAAAKALEDAADENAVRSDTLLKTMQNMADSREYELADIVRYGAFSAEAKAMESRLRARAAAVRGEGA